VPVKPTPAVPSPAATLALLRDRPGGGVEVLLTQRHRASKFAAGDYVFPGGKLERDDNPADASVWCEGLDADAAARALGLADAPQALAYWIGAIRETFEEVGVLLATRDGAPVGVDAPEFVEYRRACARDNREFWTMVERERLRLMTDRLVYFAHWVTPEDLPLRFDTRFFAAPLPPGQQATGDGHEVIDLRWLEPGEALAAQRGGAISLRLPTMQNLALFEGAATSAEALARLGGREIRMMRPRVLLEHGERRVLLPGDPGWY
jgi:8-oxo-dGTP pyrophosphatase MutT (NUDIX family)